MSAMWRRDSIRAITVLAFMAAGAAGGCGRGDDLSVAIEESRSTLVAMTGSGSVAAPAELRERKYADVVRKLQEKLSDNADPATVSSANLVLAQAIAGQAELAAGRARETDAHLAALITRARAILARVRDQAALAASREGYDPAAQIADLDKQAGARQQEIVKFTTDLQANEAKLKALRDKAAVESNKAADARKRERALLAGVTDKDASERLPVVEQASEIRRAGDANENAAADFEAQAARIE
ncbi:MAG TPA: hypothetical protein VG797_09460, partial [Phycisphaerales bacterium]|nr:hypothetical protein [Phycisphaerales bacterium]